MGNQDVSERVRVEGAFPLISSVVPIYSFPCLPRPFFYRHLHPSMNSVTEASLLKESQEAAVPLKAKSSFLSRHQLHDQSCFLLRTHRPPSSGLRLSPECHLGKKIKKNLSRNVKRSLSEGWRDCLFDRKPAACHHKPVISQSMWVGDLFCCRHSSHFVLQRRGGKKVAFIQLFKGSHASEVHLKDGCSFPKEERTDYFFPSWRQTKKRMPQRMRWYRYYHYYYYFLALIHQVQKLNHANALSNYCHGDRTPTFNAVRFIVKRKQIISVFHFLNVPN